MTIKVVIPENFIFGYLSDNSIINENNGKQGQTATNFRRRCTAMRQILVPKFSCNKRQERILPSSWYYQVHYKLNHEGDIYA